MNRAASPPKHAPRSLQHLLSDSLLGLILLLLALVVMNPVADTRSNATASASSSLVNESLLAASSSAPASVTPTAAAFADGTAAFADGTAAHAAHGGALSFSFYSASFSKFSYDYFGVEGAERKEEAWEAFRVAATLCAALIAAHSVAVGYICWRDLTGQWDKYQLIPERAPELGKVYWKGYKKFVFDIVFMLLPALTLVARFRLGAVQHATEHDPHWLSFVKQFVGYVSLSSYQLF